MMTKTLLLGSFLIIFQSFLYSQAVYRIDYHYDLDIGREDYSALLFCYEDGSGEARIRFIDAENNEENIVEVQLEQYTDYNDKGEITGLYFATFDPKSIKGTIINNDDHFIFEKAPDSDEFEPTGVISVDENGNIEIEGEIDDMKILDQADINKALFDEFFDPKEDVYVNEVINDTRPVTAPDKLVALHLILVANTLDKKIGKTCETDKKNVLDLFKEIASYLGIVFIPTVISDENFSRTTVLEALNKLSPSPNDIVVFYYSGHGYNSKSNFPNIDLRYKSSLDVGGENAMNMEEIYNYILAKKARLNLVISDCCNNEISDATNEIADAPSLRSTSVGWSKINAMNLFLKVNNSIVMTAASKGQLSAGNINDGGFFTSNFLDNIEKSLGKFTSFDQNNWNFVVTQAKARTIDKAASSRCRMPDKSIKNCNQTPFYLLK